VVAAPIISIERFSRKCASDRESAVPAGRPHAVEICALLSIQISDRAKSQLVKLGVGRERFLRINVVPGGCSGNSYSAAVDDALGENDKLVYQEDDLRVVADRQSAPYLDGLDRSSILR